MVVYEKIRPVSFLQITNNYLEDNNEKTHYAIFELLAYYKKLIIEKHISIPRRPDAICKLLRQFMRYWCVWLYIVFKCYSWIKRHIYQKKNNNTKNFYAYLDNSDIIEINPFTKLKFKFRQEQRLPKTLSINEVSKLLNCFEIDTDGLSDFKKQLYIRDDALLDLLISTGIRIGEAAIIKLDDIITAERTILIHGKGRKQRLIYISSSVTWERLSLLIKERKKPKVIICLLIAMDNPWAYMESKIYTKSMFTNPKLTQNQHRTIYAIPLLHIF